MYARADVTEGACRTDLLNGCRTRAFFAINPETRQLKVISNACRLRWCPLCSGARQRVIAAATLEWLKQQPRPKFLTLTLKHTDAPLHDQITRLYDCFRKLRRQKIWKKNVSGGIWFFQIKLGADEVSWHPHLHIVLNGNYMRHAILKEIWHSITTDSTIIDIRSVKNAEKAAGYVARYAAKPCDMVPLSPRNRYELLVALHGRRICGAVGKAHGICLGQKRPDDGGDWIYIASWSTMRSNYACDENYRRVWKCFMLRSVIESQSDYDLILQLAKSNRPPPVIANTNNNRQMIIENWCSQ